MYLPLIIIIVLISVFGYWKRAWDFLITKRKYISWVLYLLSILSFLYLTDSSNQSIHETWERALDLLWFILFLPILAKVFQLELAKKLMLFRKEIWILMWVLAFIHSLQYFIWEYSYWFWEKDFWVFNGSLTYLAYWFIALIITIALTITSNNYSMKMLWKKWKYLHRTVYVLLIFTLLHVLFMKLWWMHENELIFKIWLPLFLYIIWKILQWKKVTLIKN